MGVPYKTFWGLTPKSLQPFIEAFRLKQEFETGQANFTAWLNGIYVTHAIAANFGKNATYPDKPFELGGGSDETAGNKDAALFEAWALSFNREFEGKAAT